MLVQAGLIVAGELLLESSRVLADDIQYAPLTIRPTLFPLTKQPVEKPVRDHLLRQSVLVSGPAHVSLHALAEGFLRNANLQRAESRVAAELGRNHLVDRRPTRPPSGEPGASHQPAHRVGVPVAPSSGGRVVYTTEHVNV